VEKWWPLSNGSVDVVIASNSTARMITSGSGTVKPYIPPTPTPTPTPPPPAPTPTPTPTPPRNLQPNEPLYKGAAGYGADLEPVFKDLPNDPRGDVFSLDKWVDERTVAVDMSPPFPTPCNWHWDPSKQGNGVRDWLEAKLWDFYCSPPGWIRDTPDENAALWMFDEAVGLLGKPQDPSSEPWEEGFGEDYNELLSAGVVAYVKQYGATTPTTVHHKIWWNPVADGIRNSYWNRFNGSSGLVQNYEFEIVFDPDTLMQSSALHELRHVFQGSLTKSDEGGFPDGDYDGLPEHNPGPVHLVPDDLSELRDYPHISQSPTALWNTDFHFSEEYEMDVGKYASERDAVRFSMEFKDGSVPSYACHMQHPEVPTGAPYPNPNPTVISVADPPASVKVMVASVPPTGTKFFVGGLPVKWINQTRSICHLLDKNSNEVPEMVIAASTIWSADLFYSEAKVKGVAAGQCNLQVSLIDPVAPAPTDCVAPSGNPPVINIQVVSP
jgi:hypothetical protein